MIEDDDLDDFEGLTWLLIGLAILGWLTVVDGVRGWVRRGR